MYITELNQSSFDSLYPKFLEVAESYKFLYQWNMTKILGREKAPEKLTRLDNWFVVKDLALNSVYASGWSILADLAKEVGDLNAAAKCEAEAKTTSSAILRKMYIKEQGILNA